MQACNLQPDALPMQAPPVLCVAKGLGIARTPYQWPAAARWAQSSPKRAGSRNYKAPVRT